MSPSLRRNARFAVLAWSTTLATALSFAPLLEGFGYILAAAVVTVVPMLAGIALRAARLPAWIVLVGQMASLVLWVTLLYADGAVLGILPTPQAAESIRILLDAGFEAARNEPPPAPASTGLVLLTTLGIAACHLLVDVFAATLHRVPLTGLPLLALYTVPAAIAPDGVPTMAFLAGSSGFVLLLTSDERTRLGQWGRHLTHGVGLTAITTQRRITDSTINAAAQRVGVVAIGVAAAVPLLLPGFPDGVIGGQGSGPGEGGTVSVNNPIVDIRRDLRELSTERAMTVRTEGPPPEYFRLAVLDEFDGRRWQFSPRRLNTGFRLDRPLVAPPGLDADVESRTQSFTVDVSSRFESDWLPAPYAPTEVRAPGDWRYNPDTLDIIASDDDLTTSGLTYDVSALLSNPTGTDLFEATGAPSRILSGSTDLPDDLSDEVKDLTEEIVGIGNRYEKAVRLQQWFREPGRFEYTLDRPQGHSDDDLARFLLDDRRGYCEQFAAAMAVMARYTGIPTRVAVGFLRPTRVDVDEYEYTYAAMHAWPELYFEGSGWVRFEPTPAARDGAVAPSYSTGEIDEDENRPTSDPSASASPTEDPTRRQREPDPSAAAGDSGGGGGWGTGAIVTLGVLAVLATIPGLLRLAIARRRWARAGDERERAEAAWSEIRDTYIDLRHPWPDTTLRRTARVIQDRLKASEAADAALRRIALTVERARFARVATDDRRLRDDVDTVCAALRQREARVDRWRARLLPRSLREGYRRWVASRPVSSQTRDDDASALPSAP
jgi:transglutaminase-like putative cysteine protease